MNYIAMLHKLTPILPLVLAIAAAVTILCALLLLGFRLLQWRRALRWETIWLELIPPANTVRSARSTQELFAIIHGLRAARPFKDRLLHREVVISFEILSTRERGIRYLVQVDKEVAASPLQTITSYLPDVKVSEVQIDASEERAQVMEFKQTEHYAFPLAVHASLDLHDPVAYLTGMMTKLEPDEHVNFQIILTPVRLREASILARKILGNEDLLSHLSGRKIPFWSQATGLLNKAAFGAADTIGEVYHGTTKGSYTSSRADYEGLRIAKRQRPSRTLSAFELEIMELMHRKLNQPLFRVSIRASVVMSDQQAAREKLNAIKSSMQTYSAPPYQTLTSRIGSPLVNKLPALCFYA